MNRLSVLCLLLCLLLLGLVRSDGELTPTEAAAETIDSPEVQEKIRAFKEAESIKGIQKSFAHLPDSELQRIVDLVNGERDGINFTVDSLIFQPVPIESSEAIALKHLWDLRQQELKRADQQQLSPVTEMRRIMTLVDEFVANSSRYADFSELRHELPHPGRRAEQQLERVDRELAEAADAQYDAVSNALHDLESLLEDLDNARDFHSVGLWDALVSQLESPWLSSEHRALVAWCVGTAVKNTEEYQSWTIQTPTHMTEPPLHLLVQLLVNASLPLDDWDVYGETFNTAEPGAANAQRSALQNKVLYALSAATGNNPAVQRDLLTYWYPQDGNSGFTSELLDELRGGGPPLTQLTPVFLERVRKGWNLLSDLLLQSLDRVEDSVSVDPSLRELLREQYCLASWDMLLEDHLTMSSADGAAAAQRDQDCANSAARIDTDESAQDVEGEVPTPFVLAADVKKRSVLAGINRAVHSVQLGLRELCA